MQVNPMSVGYPTLNPTPQVSPLSMYGQVLGIKEQQQALQNQQVQNQLLQQQALQGSAELPVAQQKAAEQMALSKQDWSADEFHNQDGSLNGQAVADQARKIAPLTGDNYAQNLIKTGDDITAFRGHAMNLGEQATATYRNSMLAVANNPDAKVSDYYNAENGVRDKLLAEGQSPKSVDGLIAAGHTLMFDAASPKDADGKPTGQTPNAAQLRATVQNYARMGAQNGGMQPGEMNLGNVNTPTATDIITGRRSTPQGALAMGLTPGEQPSYQAQMQGQTAGIQQDVQVLGERRAAAQAAPFNKSLADAYQSLTAPGSGTQSVAANPTLSALAKRFSMDPQATTNAQLAEKVHAALVTSAEAGGRDAAERETLGARVPPPSSNPDTIKDWADSFRANADNDVARFQNLQKNHVAVGRPQGASETDSRFVQSNPAPSMTPATAASYKSTGDVAAAYKSGKLTRAQAAQILQNQFKVGQ